MDSLNILNLNDDCLLNVFQYLGILDHLNLLRTCLRFRQILLESSHSTYPVFHSTDPHIKPVLFYSSTAFKVLRILNNNVNTLGVIQGHGQDIEEVGNSVKDFQILNNTLNKINKRECLENLLQPTDIFRFTQKLSGLDYLSVNVPSCICYLEEFFQTISDLRALRLSGYSKCSETIKTIWKCFPNLKDLSIRGGCLRNRSDFELIAQMKTVRKLSLNVGERDCLAPLAEMTELYSLYLENNNGCILAIDIIEIIKGCRKLEFLYCYQINHGDRPQESVANLFRMIKIHRDPSKQKPLQLFAYLDPPLSIENKMLIDNAYFEYRPWN
ncbi:uncharacterized protein LOC6493106 [Drosophila ananassae]|uniref:uncharacterized protein LOC6493106 n=1 Tax=Drosophila ananassae TaxID=7217 RepID=UPI0013A5BFF5|nr:uncharacterized protein LOC6493106 [Drosophila ananassae]